MRKCFVSARGLIYHNARGRSFAIWPRCFATRSVIKMTRDKIATLLLNHVPEDQRAHAVQHAVRSLDSKSDENEIGLVADLLHQHSDEQAHIEFVNHLLASITDGTTGRIAALCKTHPSIERTLLKHTTQYLSQVPGQLHRKGDKKLIVVMISPEMHDPITTEDGEMACNDTVLVAQTTAYLQFMIQVSFHELHTDEVTSILTACCAIVGAKDENLSSRAHDCIVKLLESHPEICLRHCHFLWGCMNALVNSKLAFFERQGYTLWLRWAVSKTAIDKSLMQDPIYWELLKQGLRLGDSERRKSALQIFRLSIDNAVEDAEALKLITAESHIDTPTKVRQHYDRFCTVFETIVLGRYFNQVQECEADLDFLASSQSIVKAPWLLMLLSSALDPNLQDSNRKFIGRWIMQSNLYMNDRSAYDEFFRHSFLPWATQGHLFTSSIRTVNRVTTCVHGENLADCISRLIQISGDRAGCSSIIDIVLDFIIGRQGSKFAYTWVYSVEGLGRGIHSNPSLKFTAEQLKRVRDLLSLTGCPEVARDHIHLRAWKLIDDMSSRSSNTQNDIASTESNRWTSIQTKLRQLNTSASAQTDGPIASWTSHLSKRDLHEQKIIANSTQFLSEIEAMPADQQSLDIVDEQLNDIWSELEYLEYPKDLLIVISKLILSPAVILLAGQDNNAPLSQTIPRILKLLFELSNTRAYLIAPLIASIRDLFNKYPGRIFPFELDTVILQLIEKPPEPTVDIKFEDCTCSLIKAIDPSCQVLGYEYYYGPREGFGVANLLDLISRLWMVRHDNVEKILNSLLQRWVEQKIPPPTVSLWKNVMHLQTMVICAEYAISTATAERATKLLKDFQYMLSIEPLPRYRYLLEWIITRLCIRHPVLQPLILDELRTKDHHSNPKFLASLMKISVRVAKFEETSEDFASKLADVFVPLAASSKIVIRHEAQWQIPLLLDHAEKSSWASLTQNAALGELNSFIRTLARFDDPPLERKIDVFDPIHDHTMTNLVEGPWWKLDDIEQPLCNRSDFETLFALDESKSPGYPPPANSCIPLGPAIPNPASSSSSSSLPSSSPQDSTRRILQNIDNISRALNAGPGPTALQTKGAAYLSSSSSRRHNNNLIVVASLVDNPHNLGGLSRVAEIFGASAMHVRNTQVTSTKDFTNVSVSSHLHLPILGLPEKELAGWLANKRKEEGYEVVGIEQTDRSVKLGSEGCRLPERCVLVVGSEREGIPALVLGECDLLVEIPQVGVTRSLNVQTAAGIVLCEYARQFGKK